MGSRSETITKPVDFFVRNFSGRQGDADYDHTKQYGLHRRQRAYVWGRDRQLKLLDSILRGLYIPPIICNSHIVNDINKRDIMEGGNRATTMGRILNGSVRELTEDEKFTVRSYQIQIVLMENLNLEEQREMFRRLNNSVKVSDGHLYAMSEDDSPLVQEAAAFLNDELYPLRARITGVFFDTVNADNDGKANLANAIAIVSGAAHGVEFITKSFERQESRVESNVPIDRDRVVRVVGDAISVFERADAACLLENKTKRKIQMSIGWALGAVMYDLTMNHTEREAIIDKWVKWLIAVRRGDANAKDAIEIKGAQNITSDKLKRKSYKVQKFIETGELVTDEELKSIRHSDDDDDNYSDTTDE